ncbi:hypothetical protein IJT93_07920 [bacterium]|nr:hypothetical protein [bacterium]
MEIKFSYEIIELFKSADQIYEEWKLYSLCRSSSGLDGWNIQRSCLYINGPILGLLREKNKSLLEFINTKPVDALRDNVVKLLQWTKQKSDEHIKKIYNSYEKNVFQIAVAKYGKSLPKLTKDNILAWTYAYNDMYLADMKDYSSDSQVAFLYVCLGYDYYREEKIRHIDVEQQHIKELYDRLKDSNFRKYGLLPVDRERIFIVANPCRIYDKTLNHTIFLTLKHQMGVILNSLFATGKINKLSFRGKDTDIYPGKCTIEYLNEQIEYGPIFKYNVKELPKVTKLCSKNYNDQLWIMVKNCEITFEELCDDINIYDESIAKQVIHLVYDLGDNTPVITHIDHEYVFYDAEEYERRLNDPDVKGTKLKRFKTFKVDNAHIEMDYPCNVIDVQDENNVAEIKIPFIYFVLNVYFTHKDLLLEYFEDILK